MKLSEYLAKTQIKRSDFADAIGVHPSYITLICNGSSWPGRDVCNRISQATGGKVTANDFVDEAALRQGIG